MEEIISWLEAPTYYYEVVKLYKKHGAGGFLVTLFETGEDDYNREKLEAELRKIVAQHTKAVEEQRTAYPEALQTELEKAQELMDERADLKAQLRRSWRRGESAKEREAMTLRVLEIKAEIDHVYATEKYYTKMKAMPADDFDSEDEIAELMRRRNTVRTYVSRYKDKPDSEKYKEYADELFQVNEKLRVLGVTIQD